MNRDSGGDSGLGRIPGGDDDHGFARTPGNWSPTTLVLAIVLVIALGYLWIGWQQATAVTAELTRTQREVRDTVAMHRVDTLTNHVAMLRALGAPAEAVRDAEDRLRRAEGEVGGDRDDDGSGPPGE